MWKSKNKQKMDITIKENDAFNTLVGIVDLESKELKESIIDKMIQSQYLIDDGSDHGKTIEDILNESNDFTIKDVEQLVLSNSNNDELREILKGIQFWGTAMSWEECQICGCISETERIENTMMKGDVDVLENCENHNCENHSNE